jgi:hypothetical protein
MKQSILFNKVKVTNNPMQNPNQVKISFLNLRSFLNDQFLKILLNSMHRYIIRLHIIQASDDYSIRTGPLSTFIFHETVFIAVTAYQNEQVNFNEFLFPSLISFFS